MPSGVLGRALVVHRASAPGRWSRWQVQPWRVRSGAAEQRGGSRQVSLRRAPTAAGCPVSLALVVRSRGVAVGCRGMLEELVNGGYVDVQTRAVFVQFTTYNPVVSVYCYHTVALEVVRGGGVIGSSMFETVRLYVRLRLVHVRASITRSHYPCIGRPSTLGTRRSSSRSSGGWRCVWWRSLSTSLLWRCRLRGVRGVVDTSPRYTRPASSPYLVAALQHIHHSQ